MTEGKKNDRIDGKVRMEMLPFPELEEWKPIDGFPQYYISNYGRVKSMNYYKRKFPIIMKTQFDIGGYEVIKLRNNERKTRTLRINRLVAKAFIPNPENKPHVDHINTIRTDNRSINLRWCTDRENKNNPLTIKKRKTSIKILESIRNAGKISIQRIKKPVLQYDRNNHILAEYDSARDAHRQTGISFQKIGQVCLGRRNTAGGYVWKFK